MRIGGVSAKRMEMMLAEFEAVRHNYLIVQINFVVSGRSGRH